MRVTRRREDAKVFWKVESLAFPVRSWFVPGSLSSRFASSRLRVRKKQLGPHWVAEGRGANGRSLFRDQSSILLRQSRAGAESLPLAFPPFFANHWVWDAGWQAGPSLAPQS